VFSFYPLLSEVERNLSRFFYPRLSPHYSVFQLVMPTGLIVYQQYITYIRCNERLIVKLEYVDWSIGLNSCHLGPSSTGGPLQQGGGNEKNLWRSSSSRWRVAWMFLGLMCAHWLSPRRHSTRHRSTSDSGSSSSLGLRCFRHAHARVNTYSSRRFSPKFGASTAQLYSAGPHAQMTACTSCLCCQCVIKGLNTFQSNPRSPLFTGTT